MPMASLPPEKLKEIMTLWHECGCCTAELARKLKRPRTTVQHWIEAARRENTAPTLGPVGPSASEMALRSTVENLRGENERLKLELAEACKPRFTVRQDFIKQSEKIRIIGIGDAHDDPNIPDKSRFEIAGLYAREQKPDVLLSIGDFLNMNSLCFHIPDENYTGKAKPTFLADIASGKEAFSALNSGLGSWEPERHMTLGNHENRLYRVEDQSPPAWGMYHMLFDEMMRGAHFTYSPYGAYTFYGGVGATHVPKSIMDKPIGGENPEITVGLNSVFDVLFGHTHVKANHTSRKIGQRHITVVNLACYLPWGHVEDFAKHTPGGWDWGLTDVIVQHGQIQSARFIPQNDLYERFGRKAA